MVVSRVLAQVKALKLSWGALAMWQELDKAIIDSAHHNPLGAIGSAHDHVERIRE
jgi:hypothetical protein